VLKAVVLLVINTNLLTTYMELIKQTSCSIFPNLDLLRGMLGTLLLKVVMHELNCLIAYVQKKELHKVMRFFFSGIESCLS
jgi:hypothetical protein